MSNALVKMTLDEARPIATDVMDALFPYCERIEIAGSFRRGRKHIGDIEVVCIPRTIEIQADLFETQLVRSPGFVQTVLRWEKVKGDPENGKYTQRIHPSGTKIDIFMPTPENWGIILLIRTGPAAYSKSIMTQLKQKGYRCEGGYVKNSKTGYVVPTYSENCVYKLLGQKPVLPFARL